MEGIGRVDDEAQVSAAEQVAGTEATDGATAVRKNDPDADWLSMAMGDPALYLKDPE